MLRGNPPPPPTSLFFFFFLSLFLHFSKKKSENFGGGLNPLNPPPLNTPLIIVIYSCHSLKNCSNYSNMKTHIDICHTTHVTCPPLAHFFNTLLTLAICEFPLVSVYDSDSSNHVLSKNIF